MFTGMRKSGKLEVVRLHYIENGKSVMEGRACSAR